MEVKLSYPELPSGILPRFANNNLCFNHLALISERRLMFLPGLRTLAFSEPLGVAWSHSATLALPPSALTPAGEWPQRACWVDFQGKEVPQVWLTSNTSCV
jgi:hypothetical protein